jgi:hypothetical protein
MASGLICCGGPHEPGHRHHFSPRWTTGGGLSPPVGIALRAAAVVTYLIQDLDGPHTTRGQERDRPAAGAGSPGTPERLPTRREHLQGGARFEKVDAQLGALLDQVLAVVQRQQRLARTQTPGQRFPWAAPTALEHADRRRHGGRYARWFGDRAHFEQPHAAWEVGILRSRWSGTPTREARPSSHYRHM